MHNRIPQLQKNRKAKARRISVLCALAVLVALGVFWKLHRTGMAMVNAPACGLEEHTHTETVMNRN